MASYSANLFERVRIVLCNTTHPGNIGAVARAMKTMGFGALVLVNPKILPDEVALARASGATDVLQSARVCTSLAEALQGCVFAAALSARCRDLGPPLYSAREAMPDLARHLEAGDVALVFGGESAGLTNEEVMQCQALVSIPANPNYSSLNLAAAVQILCYELRLALGEGVISERPGLPVSPFSGAPASLDEVEGFYKHLETAMWQSGFIKPDRPTRLNAKIRRLFGRAALEREEVNILRGILTALQGGKMQGACAKTDKNIKNPADSK